MYYIHIYIYIYRYIFKEYVYSGMCTTSLVKPDTAMPKWLGLGCLGGCSIDRLELDCD